MVASSAEVSLPLIYYRDQFDAPMTVWTIPGPYPARDPSYIYPVGGKGAPQVTEGMVRDFVPQLASVDEIWFVQRTAEKFDPDRVLVNAIALNFPCLVETIPPYAERRKRAEVGEEC